MEMNNELIDLFEKELNASNSLFNLKISSDKHRNGYYTSQVTKISEIEYPKMELAMFSKIIKQSEEFLYSKLNPIDWITIKNFSKISNLKNISHIFVPCSIINWYQEKLHDYKRFHEYYQLFDTIKLVTINTNVNGFDNSDRIYLCNKSANMATIEFFNRPQDKHNQINYSLIINNPNVIELVVE